MIVDEIGMGRFVGSYAYLKNVNDYPAPITVTVAPTSRVAVWENDALRRLIDNDTELSRRSRRAWDWSLPIFSITREPTWNFRRGSISSRGRSSMWMP